jgi:phosphoribosylanthranilate isomerase
MIVKVCGISDPEFIHHINELQIDLIGFIFYQASKRYLGNSILPEPIKSLPESLKKVGVFVNEKKEYILHTTEKYQLDYAQLHGDENPLFVKEISKSVRVIKAFRLSSSFDFNKLSGFEDLCAYYLFDTKDKLYGGTGKKFNWNMLTNYTGNTPFLLSGGITVSDAEGINTIKHSMFAGVDINSGFETEPGKKDIQQIQQFTNQLI